MRDDDSARSHLAAAAVDLDRGDQIVANLKRSRRKPAPRANRPGLALDPSTLDTSFDSMRPENPTDGRLTPDLLVEVHAAAAEEHREPAELVREAVTRYLEQRRARQGAVP
jgi:hypothetical protein